MRATVQEASMRLRAQLSGWLRPRHPEGDASLALADLRARVERLEAGLEALEDSTYRQDVMHDAKIAELRHSQKRT